jgi:hypothetical protein
MTKPSSTLRRNLCLFGIPYLIVIASVTIGMLQARQSALAVYGTSDAQAMWDQWRDKATDDATRVRTTPGEVQRRIPRSEAPPALRLMQDYFITCLAFALLMTTLLYAASFVLLRGVLGQKSPEPDRLPDA